MRLACPHCAGVIPVNNPTARLVECSTCTAIVSVEPVVGIAPVQRPRHPSRKCARREQPTEPRKNLCFEGSDGQDLAHWLHARLQEEPTRNVHHLIQHLLQKARICEAHHEAPRTEALVLSVSTLDAAELLPRSFHLEGPEGQELARWLEMRHQFERAPGKRMTRLIQRLLQRARDCETHHQEALA
jgi:hypothetical protein